MVQNTDRADSGDPRKIAWGRRVSTAFKHKVIAIAAELGTQADFLMSVIAVEGEFCPSRMSYDPNSSAVGLIQFLASTALRLQTNREELMDASALQQLDYVRLYLLGYRGSLQELDSLYMAVFCPRAIGQKDDFVVFRRPSIAYDMNRSLDTNRDGIITRVEACARVRDALKRGREVHLG